MNTTQNLRQSIIAIGLFIVLLVVYNTAKAQTLSIKGNVTLEDKSTLERYNVRILDMSNDKAITFIASKRFNYQLEYNKEYMIFISYKGMQSKAIYFDTKCELKKNLTFEFDCNLIKTQADNSKICKAGGVFYASGDKTWIAYSNQ